MHIVDFILYGKLHVKCTEIDGSKEQTTFGLTLFSFVRAAQFVNARTITCFLCCEHFTLSRFIAVVLVTVSNVDG